MIEPYGEHDSPLSGSIYKGKPCTETWWAQAWAQGRPDYARFRQLCESRRHQQAVPGVANLVFEPSMAATAELYRRKLVKRQGAASGITRTLFEY